MEISVDEVIKSALDVLKKYPKETKGVVLYGIGPAAEALERVFSELDIPCRYSQYTTFAELVKDEEASDYKIDTTMVSCNGSSPNMERLRDYWEKGQPPRTLWPTVQLS